MVEMDQSDRRNVKYRLEHTIGIIQLFQQKMVKFSSMRSMEADGTAEQLYQRALRWASMDQMEPYNIILFEDEEAKELTVQRSFRYILGKGSQAMRDESQKIKYQIKLQLNDGQYQYTMTDFKDFNADYDIIEYLDIYQVSDKTRQQYESQIKSQIIQAVEGYRTKRRVQLGVIDKLAGNLRGSE